MVVTVAVNQFDESRRLYYSHLGAELLAPLALWNPYASYAHVYRNPRGTAEESLITKAIRLIENMSHSSFGP